jgi:hypothetical protein
MANNMQLASKCVSLKVILIQTFSTLWN